MGVVVVAKAAAWRGRRAVSDLACMARKHAEPSEPSSSRERSPLEIAPPSRREARFRAIVESVLNGLVLVDRSGKIVLVNREIERLFGYSREALLGQPIERLVPTRFRERHREFRAAYCGDPQARAMGAGRDLFGRRKDGTEIPVEIGLNPIETDEGLFVLASVVDISARNRAEKKRGLLATQARLRQVLTSSPAVLYASAISAEGLSPTWVSENIVRITGYEAREATTPTWWLEHLHPEDRGRVEREIPKLLTEGRLTTEYRFRRKDGSYAWLHDDSRLLLDAVGKPVEAFGAWLDVGERKQSEEALRKSERRFRELAENVREVFFVADPETGQALYLSPAYEEVFGRSRERAYAPPTEWLEAVHPEDRTRLVAAIVAGAEGTEPGSEVFRVVRPDGLVRWIRSRVSPVRDASGKVARTVGILEDITELRRTQEQLFGAQKMEAVGRLAGGLAHDFNNVLTAILGSAELLLLDTPPGAPQREDLDTIRDAATRAQDLIRQLLAFSARQVLKPMVLDLNHLVENVNKMLRRLISEDIELVTVLARDLGAVRADAGQIEQVLVNLAMNARDAMPAGGRLTIETANAEVAEADASPEAQVAPGRYVMLRVTDTGVGMDPETQAHVFEPFFTRKRPGKGTGLGLATVYGIVRQSDGHITVDSAPGLGATFRIYLPRTDEPAERVLAPAPAAVLVGGTETVLLAEDEHLVRLLARKVLEQAGYKVLVAAGGAEALQIAELYDGPIHLLVTDVVMPEMSGRELMHRLTLARPGVPVLYLSGYSDEAVARRGVLDPGTAFMQKPFTPQGLAHKVRDVLDLGQAGG